MRQQHLHHLGNAASLVKLDDHVFAAGFEIAQHRNFTAKGFKVVDRQFDADRVGDRQQVSGSLEGVFRSAVNVISGTSVFCTISINSQLV